MAEDPAFGAVAEPRWSDAGGRPVGLVTATLATHANSAAAYDAIDRLRGELVPAAEVPAEVMITGDTAFNADFFAQVDAWTPRIFAFVLGLSFLLLMLAFRSIVVPIKAILMNLLSVGAAYGLLVLVFQKGVGADLLGFQQTPTIEAWLPLFLFTVLFGLSMDYHVFLLSRIREHYDATHDNRGVGRGGSPVDRPHHHRGGADHGRRLRRVRLGAAGLPPADGLRPGGRGLPRRDDRPLGPGAGEHGAARRPQLVPAALARLAARPADRGRAATVAHRRNRGTRTGSDGRRLTFARRRWGTGGPAVWPVLRPPALYKRW